MAKTDPHLDLLADVRLFQGLAGRELKAVLGVAKETAFRPGQALTIQGQPGNRFHLIVDGVVTITIDGRQRDTAGVGAYIREISLIDGGPRTATVMAGTAIAAENRSSASANAHRPSRSTTSANSTAPNRSAASINSWARDRGGRASPSSTANDVSRTSRPLRMRPTTVITHSTSR